MGEFSLTVVDVLVALVVLVSALYAMYRGLMRETLSIFAWAMAAYTTLRFFPTFRPLPRSYISPDWLADFCVFAGIFLLVLVPLSFLSFRFGESMKRSEVGPVDRSLGLIFGIGRGLVIFGLAYVVFAALVPLRDHPRWLTEAQLFPLVQGTGEVLLSLVPDTEEFDEQGSRTASTGRTTVPTTAQAPRTAPVPRFAPVQDEALKSYGENERSALDSLVEAATNEERPPQ